MNLRVEPTATTGTERVAVVGPEIATELGPESGYVRLGGHDAAVVRVESAETTDPGAVRLDADLRGVLGVDVGDRVAVESVSVDPADRVTLGLPAESTVPGPGLALREHLVDRAVTEGDVLRVALATESVAGGASGRLPVEVVETHPSGSVVVCEWTDIRVAAEPVDGLALDAEPESVTYDDVGGLEAELDRVRELVELPVAHPAVFERLWIDPPRGLLLYGPPGTGKTLLTRAVVGEVDGFTTTVSGPEIASATHGETEKRLREVFEEAAANAPAVVVIDEVDAIAPRREDASEIERRAVAQLLSLMDGLGERGQVVVVATTNRADSVDPALRRPGRFDREIEVGVPDEHGREAIFGIHTRGVPLADDADLAAYARDTHGFVGADIENLIRESAMCALRRVRPELDAETRTLSAAELGSLRVTDADIRSALSGVEPSALREVFVEVPDVSWADVGGLDGVKDRLRETIEWPLAYPGAFERVALRPATGVLLYGPPGTGKTLLAKAVANEATSNFISVKGPELLDKYVGESEKGVREVFSKARENAPTVVFFDEIDAIAGQRGETAGDAGVGERVVSQLLTELDGLEDLEGVVVIAATNRPDLIDDALVRPGRLDRHVHVSPPDEAAREAIFAVHTREKPLGSDVDLAALAARTEGYVGADIEAVCREAATAAVREYVRATNEGMTPDVATINLTLEHFERALADVDPTGAQDGHTDGTRTPPE